MTSIENRPAPDIDPQEARRFFWAKTAIFIAVLLWGGSFSAMRVAVGALSPLSVMWIRMMTGLLLVVFLHRYICFDGYRKGDWKYLIFQALFQPCGYFLFESFALKFTTSSQAGVISATLPLMVAFGAFLFLSEPIAKKSLAGLFLSLAGVAGLTFLQAPGGAAENPVLGNALEVGAMACAAANIMMAKRLMSRYNPFTLTAIQIGAGSLFFSPGIAGILNAPASAWSLQVIGCLVFLGGCVTLGAFGLYNWGMSKIPASKASAFINLVPVAAVALGWIFLDEALSMSQCLAAVAVGLGVWMSQDRAAPVRSAPKPVEGEGPAG